MRKNKTITYASKDFMAEFLPRNRKEQFKFILKTRFPMLMALGGILLASALPLIICLLFKDNYFYNIFLIFESENITEEGFLLMSVENNFFFTLIAVGCLLIFSIFLAGVLNIIKKLVMGKPIFFGYDFWRGVKINSVTCIVLTLILGIFLSLLALLFRFIFLDILFIVALVVFLILIVPFFMNLYFYKTLYKADFKTTLANGLFLYRASGFKGFGLMIILIIIPISSNLLADLLVITVAANMIINSIYFLFLLPLFLLVLYCFYYSIFDEHLNKFQFVEYYKSGLYKANTEPGVSNDENKVEE